MTPPTQSPATVAAEAINETVYMQNWLCSPAQREEILDELASIVESAYSSTEQELREARRLLQNTLKTYDDMCEWESTMTPSELQTQVKWRENVASIEAFLSKNSNLPRE